MGFAMTLVYVAFVFLRPQELYPELAPYRVMDILAGLATLATAFSIVTGGPKPLLGGPEWRLGVAYILWCAFSVAAAIKWFGGALTTLADLSIPFFTFVLVMLNVCTRRRLAVVVVLVWMSALVLLGQAFHAYYSGVETSPFFITMAARGGIDEIADSGSIRGADADADADSGADADGSSIASAPQSTTFVRRIQALGFLADPNDLAQFLLAIIPLLGLAWKKGRPFRNLMLVLAPGAVALWGVILTRSRGGLVAAAGMIAVTLIYRLDPRWRRPVSIAAVGLCMPAFVALFGYAKADESAASRLEAWSAGLLMLKGSPIWGVGYNQFIELHGRVAHNSYVQCFAETGLIGYFLWLGYIAVGFMRVSSVADRSEDPDWKRWGLVLRLSIIGFVLGALFLSRTTSPLLSFLVSLVAVLAAMAGRDGEVVRMTRHWWAIVIAVEFFSVMLVWLTSRAYHY